ncbi:MAG: peptidoglycan DD-metalloendopeptidase family protein [Clostridia bacterium]|nr:peptidoglycan DD-metalloendopeptidase family protein [Clostridia bacterium]
MSEKDNIFHNAESSTFISDDSGFLIDAETSINAAGEIKDLHPRRRKRKRKRNNASVINNLKNDAEINISNENDSNTSAISKLGDDKETKFFENSYENFVAEKRGTLTDSFENTEETSKFKIEPQNNRMARQRQQSNVKDDYNSFSSNEVADTLLIQNSNKKNYNLGLDETQDTNFFSSSQENFVAESGENLSESIGCLEERTEFESDHKKSEFYSQVTKQGTNNQRSNESGTTDSDREKMLHSRMARQRQQLNVKDDYNSSSSNEVASIPAIQSSDSENYNIGLGETKDIDLFSNSYENLVTDKGINLSSEVIDCSEGKSEFESEHKKSGFYSQATKQNANNSKSNNEKETNKSKERMLHGQITRQRKQSKISNDDNSFSTIGVNYSINGQDTDSIDYSIGTEETKDTGFFSDKSENFVSESVMTLSDSINKSENYFESAKKLKESELKNQDLATKAKKTALPNEESLDSVYSCGSFSVFEGNSEKAEGKGIKDRETEFFSDNPKIFTSENDNLNNGIVFSSDKSSFFFVEKNRNFYNDETAIDDEIHYSKNNETKSLLNNHPTKEFLKDKDKYEEGKGTNEKSTENADVSEKHNYISDNKVDINQQSIENIEKTKYIDKFSENPKLNKDINDKYSDDFGSEPHMSKKDFGKEYGNDIKTLPYLAVYNNGINTIVNETNKNDEDTTIAEDAENNLINSGKRIIEDNIYTSIKIDKFTSENEKVKKSSQQSQQLKSVSKQYRKKQQYKLADEAKKKIQAIKAAFKYKAAAKASSTGLKGILTTLGLSEGAVPVIIIVIIILIAFMFISSLFLLIYGVTDGLITTTYTTTNKEITSATEYYSKLESELLADVNSEIERLNNDDDISRVETEFDVIEHNPEQLISYLCAVYPGFDFNGDVINFLVTHLTGMPYYGSMKNVMEDMFDYQYSSEIKYTTYWVGKKKHTIATVYIYNKGFDNTVEYFLQNLPEEYYEENEKENVYTHYQQLREYRGNHGFWVDSPVDYDWRQYVVGLYGYETEDGGITSVSKGELLQNTDAGIEVTDEDLNHYEQKSLGLFTITGYCPCKICCGKYSPEVTGKPSSTASGTSPAANRTIAVDPKVIPLGSKVLINGHIYTAEDTGGAIKGNKIDIYYATHQEALAQGKQLNTAVFLLQPKTNTTLDSESTAITSDNNLASIALSEWEGKVTGIPNKYTKWYGEVGGTNIYNWCAVFVSWCVNEAYMTDIVPTTAEVSVLMENAKKSGTWRGKDGYIPSPGDIMIQKSNGASHTGIVVDATDTYFDTVEGNTGSSNIHSSKVGKYRYYYSDADTLTGFIKTSDETSTGGSLYYKFTNYATGTDIIKHSGIDIAGDSSTDVLAVIDGEVIEKTENSITIENEMYLVKYSSLKNITVNKGENIISGSTIAKMSDTENRGIPYVHIELIAQDGNEEMDPFIYCNIGAGTAPKISLANTLVNVGIGGGTVSAEFGNIHAPYTDEFASRAVVTSSFFDTYHSSFHRAIDLDVTYGSNVGIAAAWDGKVVLVGSGSGNGMTGYGYVVVLEHVIDGVKVYTKYNHMKMNSSTLKVGDIVAAGDQIGIQGATGNVSGEHLDFQIGICSNSYNWNEFSNNLVNPIAIYQGWTQSINTVSIWNSSGTCIRKGDDYNQTRLVNNMSGKHIF